MSLNRVSILLLVLLGFPNATDCEEALRDKRELFQYAAQSGERTWRKVNELPGNLSSRELYLYALALCGAKLHPERLERLFEIGARMQDRDEASRGYGNFRWSWEDGAVLDFNAVEFCVQSAALIWIRHRDRLPPKARKILRETLELAAQGSLGHRVPSSYTNIALMNAQSLILLGESLKKSEFADEGYRRLERVCLYTWESGVHEYDSPTYYGVDLDCLVLIEAFCERESGRKQARALLKLLWSDIALNWWHKNQRLAGTRSRDYNYLYGLGYLDVQMWYNGWLEGDARGGVSLLYPLLGRWRPDENLRDLSESRFPRLVRQKWGVGGAQSRTHLMLEDVSLSTSGANYGPMDLPLTVDLPCDRDYPRCYFIPDARRDPYGKKKIPAGPHEKTLHLRPFWCGAQRRVDALGLAVYRPGDFPETPATLESHFVFPRAVDELWVGGKEVRLPKDGPAIFPLENGEPLFFRKGPAVVGIRVPYTRGLDGEAAPVALVHDSNRHGVLRLTVAHHSFWGVERSDADAAACFWVRVGDGVESDEAFANWRAEFISPAANVRDTEDLLEIQVEGADGPLGIAAASPFLGFLRCEPAHTQSVLELNGQDIGRPILAGLECIKRHLSRPAPAESEPIEVTGAAEWEAEAGVVSGAMTIAEDDRAFGSRYVWTPGEVGAIDRDNGSVRWRLKTSREGAYYLWGRVLTPTPQDDSFFVRISTDKTELVTRSDWHTGLHNEWEWTAVSLNRSSQAAKLFLPAGEVTIELLTRESGSKIDRLLLTTDPNERPN